MLNRRNNHTSTHTASVSIRWTDSDPEGLLAAVAARDSQRLSDGPWLVAEVEGETLAVLSLDTGSFVADPFSRTVELRALLELRAGQARGRVSRRRPSVDFLAHSLHRLVERPRRIRDPRTRRETDRLTDSYPHRPHLDFPRALRPKLAQSI